MTCTELRELLRPLKGSREIQIVTQDFEYNIIRVDKRRDDEVVIIAGLGIANE